MQVDDCIFCKIVSGQLPCAKVYEDQQVLAFLDIGPISPGHTLVIPKFHAQRLTDCPADTVAAVGQKVGAIARAVLEATRVNDFNLLCNNGPHAGQVVPHVHFHIIPRRESDGLLGSWPAGSYAEGEMAALAQDIAARVD